MRIVNETRALSSIALDPKNARKHDDEQIGDIADSIERFGFIDQLIIRPDGQLIGGEGRVLALRRLGHKTVDCRVVHDLTEAEYRALGVALNRLPEGSTWDERLLKDILDELQGEDEGLAGLGFSDKDIDRIMKDDREIAIKTIDTDDVSDEFWISIRGPLEYQAAVLMAMQNATKAMDGVVVELGTVEIG